MIMRGTEAQERRFWGKYRGIVKDVLDPKKLGRIRATCPELTGDVLLDWAWPVMPYGADRDITAADWGKDDHGVGFFATPEQGSGVWLEFEAGDINRPLWVGVWHATPVNLNEGGPIPGSDTEFQEVRPETTPYEAINSVDPDTGEEDYPKEKVLKALRWHIASFRRLMLSLELDEDDPVGIEPYISLGQGLPQLNPVDPESGQKNKHDIFEHARDHVTHAVRDVREEAERNILELADNDIVSQAQNDHEDLAASRLKFMTDPLLATEVHTDFRPQDFLAPTPLWTEGPNAGPSIINSIWASTYATDTQTIKGSAYHTMLLMSRFRDVIIQAGDASGTDVGRNVAVGASNGVVIESFVTASAEPGTGPVDYQTSKAIHLFHRGPLLPYLDIANPPIETGRRWITGLGPGRYLHPNGVDPADPTLTASLDLPPNKTFHRLIDERSAVSFNRHLHPFEVSMSIPDKDVQFEGAFTFSHVFPPPWRPPGTPGVPGIPSVGVPTISPGRPGWGHPGQPTPGGGSSPGTTPTGGGFNPYVGATGGSVNGENQWEPGSGSIQPGATQGPAGAVGTGFINPNGNLPAGVSGYMSPPPTHQQIGGWAPFGTGAGGRGLVGVVEGIAGTPRHSGALGIIGSTLNVILQHMEVCGGLDFATASQGMESADFATFMAKWWDLKVTPLDLTMPEMDRKGLEAAPVFLERTAVQYNKAPTDFGMPHSDPFHPDPILGHNVAPSSGEYRMGPQSHGPPIINEEADLLPFGTPYEFPVASFDTFGIFGAPLPSYLETLRGRRPGMFSGTITIPGEELHFSGKTGPPCPPDRWVPTYHTPADAWGTSIPGIELGPIPYPGSAEQNTPVMTEFTRAN